ncbi:MAG TPA: CHAT domain-containing tetratricopeptide repeat protein, partial [Blastocatellia bacterium]|nr:CHAT domain-containing tetratricopeptide repeat protein [Blastocatellia bacterium]
EIGGGQTRLWRIDLSAGDYLQIRFSREIRLAARLLAPQAERVLFDTRDRMVLYEGRQNIDLRFMAEVSGSYRLEISSPDRQAGPTGYQLKIEALRPATPQDRLRVEAESAMVEGSSIIDRDQTGEERRRGLEKLEQALARWREVGDRAEELKVSQYIASDYRLYGEPQIALQRYHRAIQLARDLGDDYQVANITMALGGIERDHGNYQAALEAYQQVRGIFAGLKKRLGEALAVAAIGNTYLLLGEPRISIDYLKRAQQSLSIFEVEMFECKTLNDLGLAHRALGENQQSLQLHLRALEIAHRIENGLLEGPSLGYVGDAYLMLGDRAKAADHYTRQLNLCRQQDNRPCVARALQALGEVSFLGGEAERSLDYLGQSLALFRSMGERRMEADTLSDLARTNYSTGKLNEAREQIESALEIWESVRTNLSRQDLRVSFLSTVQNGFELHTDLLMSLDRRQPGSGYESLAFQSSERARARSLLEQLAESGARIREGADPQLLEREQALQRQLNAKAAARANAYSQKGSEAMAPIFDREISELTARYQEVEAQIRTSSPRYAALTRPAPPRLEEIQRQLLDEETVLLEFALGEKRSWLWAVTPQAIISQELPARSEIEAATRAVYQLLTARQPRAELPESKRLDEIAQADAKFQPAARDLSRMLLGSVADSLRGQWKGKRLLIVGAGALEYLPFAALPMPSGEGDYRPLIAEHEIVNLPSASVLAMIRREWAGRAPAPGAAAVFADPVFEANDPRLATTVKRRAGSSPGTAPARAAEAGSDPSPLMRSIRSLDRAGLGRLPFSRDEARAIASFVPAGSLLKATDFQASRATVMKSDLSGYRIIHFATHGLLNNEHPELSGLVLSLVDQNGEPQDGFLRMHELYNLRLRAEVVALSACQTGLGKEIRGEGLVGLTRGFMYAGAQRVVASLWQVDDLATAELMKRFYRGILKERLRPAAALRAAQLEMMRMTGGRWSSPYFWAAFVIQGEWR